MSNKTPPPIPDLVPGTELTPGMRAMVLITFTQRFTGNHVPEWAKEIQRKTGKPAPLAFTDDMEWLAHTKFWLDPQTGDLSTHPDFQHCESWPTFPLNQHERSLMSEHWYRIKQLHQQGQGVVGVVKVQGPPPPAEGSA